MSMPSFTAPSASERATLLRDIAHEHHRHVGKVLVGELAHGHEVGERLRRMGLVGQAVVDGNAGELGQLARRLLAVAAELDGVVHAAEHPRRVLHRFLVADLAAGGAEIGHVRPLVVGRHLEPGARAR